MFRKHLALCLVFMILLGILAGCAQEPAVEATEAVVAEPVLLTVAGGWTDCRALDVVAGAFTQRYPNCTVVYEYLQDYDVSLEKRMTGDDAVDLFFSTNIQDASPMLPYALDLNGCEGLKLDDTFGGLIENFTYRDANPAAPRLYAIPLGAEMRGMLVNQTLLSSLGIPTPTDQESLLAACRTLKDKGYIAFHGNPGSFSQTLLYPWICNLIANADDPQAAYDRINAHEPGTSELFREPYAFLYTLVENHYYDYKRAQTELDLFTDASDDAYARDFFNIRKQGETYQKANDIGMVAFLPAPMSLISVMEKTKEDYHSDIEYAFVLAPVGRDGGFAYVSPAHGIAINKLGKNVEWSIRFLDFLFEPENNKLFAQAFHIIPNTKEAVSYIHTHFDVPNDRISHLGQVTFDYGFYDAVLPSLMDASKANNPKYMLDDGNGNLSLYPLDHYLKELEDSLQQQ